MSWLLRCERARVHVRHMRRSRCISYSPPDRLHIDIQLYRGHTRVMVPSSHDDVIPHGDFIVGRQRLGLFPKNAIHSAYGYADALRHVAHVEGVLHTWFAKDCSLFTERRHGCLLSGPIGQDECGYS